jgi:hypothetical protein
MPSALEELFNELSDMDLGWWPFVFLRPARDQRMTGHRCLILAVLNGLPLGLFLDLLMRYSPEDEWVHPAVLPLGITLALFFFHRFTFAFFWNRRADRLKRAHARRAAWEAISRQEEDSS